VIKTHSFTKAYWLEKQRMCDRVENRAIVKARGRAGNKPGFKKAFQRYWALYIMLFVIVAYYLLFHYVPIAMGVAMAFKNVKLGMSISQSPWVGWKNFAYVVQDPEILRVVMNTLILSGMRLFWGFWPPIVLAILIFDLTSAAYKRICQTIVYIPYFFSWVVVYGIVFAFFSGNGMINSVFKALGMQHQEFLMNAGAFRWLLVGSQVWKGVGWGTILYFAAMTGVNPELYEAAKLDGAGPIQRTRVVTLPAMMPVITFSLIMALGSILNNDFEQVLLFYNAAVYSVGDIIETWVYRVGLGKMQYSVGSAVSLLKAIISMGLILSANAFSRKVTGRGMW
jgi:putative aldouronate transport system permease protein